MFIQIEKKNEIRTKLFWLVFFEKKRWLNWNMKITLKDISVFVVFFFGPNDKTVLVLSVSVLIVYITIYSMYFLLAALEFVTSASKVQITTKEEKRLSLGSLVLWTTLHLLTW